MVALPRVLRLPVSFGCLLRPADPPPTTWQQEAEMFQARASRQQVDVTLLGTARFARLDLLLSFIHTVRYVDF